MSHGTQEELPPWPTLRWPSLAYFADALLLYLAAAILGAVLFSAGVVVIARPLWLLIFATGVVVGVVGLRWGRKAIRRLSRILGMFQNHA